MASTPEAQLVELIIEAAQRRQRGEPPIDRSADAARLIVEIGNRGTHAFEHFFEQLAAELRARGMQMPSFDELPPSVAPFAAAFGSSIVIDADGELDMEATAEALDAKIEETMGLSPRKAREAQLHARIRQRVADSVAEGMRRHGLVPLRDQAPDDDDDEDGGAPSGDGKPRSDDD
jgi:hypothetical protein